MGVLLSTGNLGDWHNPELPDDPHLLRADGSAWLGSSTVDEGAAWLELRDDELAELGASSPRIASALEPGDFYLPNDQRLLGGNGDDS